MKILVRLVLLLTLVSGCSRSGQEPAAPAAGLILATTTSVGNSGLLDVLLPAYQKGVRVSVKVHLAGSGRALEMMRAGQADVVISHAPRTETEFLSANPGAFYRKLMFNDFVLVGPKDDPAGARGAADVSDAMRRIAGRAGALFVSRGDQSGTHERERELWARARVAMPPDRLLVSGQGMGVTLRQADTKRAYTLSDRATFEQVAPQLELGLVFEGGPDLLNTYAVVVARPADPAHGAAAMAFARWLTDGSGRPLIAAYTGRAATPMFTLWDPSWPRDQPADLPR